MFIKTIKKTYQVLSEGHPTKVMDMSFALQSLLSEYIVKNKASFKPGMINIPPEIEVGYLKLKTMGVNIDKLTDEQYSYIHGYEEGT